MKQRWTISMMKKYRKFCGWDKLNDLIWAVEIGMRGPSKEILVHDEWEQREAQAAIATIFETGARSCEVLGQYEKGEINGLKASDFEEKDDLLIVTLELEKRYGKTKTVTKYKATDESKMRWKTMEEAMESQRPFEEYKGYETKRKLAIRRFTIYKREPLVPTMLNWAGEITKNGGDKLFKIRYNRFYRIITEAGKKIGLEFPPHRLRAERATQLALEYDRDGDSITTWFEWLDPSTAYDYTSLAPKVEKEMMEKAREMWG